MKSRLALGFVALLCVGVAGTANANTLVDKGSFTLDTATGLDWLDLTATQNYSFNQVSSLLGAGGSFEGYRYATAAEVKTFWANAGLIGGTPEACSASFPCYAENFPVAPVAELTTLIGNTWAPDFGFSGAIGLTSTSCLAPFTCYVTPELRIFSDSASAFIVEGLRDDIANPSYASWLVRADPVAPVPLGQSPWLTLISGLVGLGFLAYRRKSKPILTAV